jgi:hydroxymethylpyrimidine pyrophosphatase-like HAD family hydrolase
MFTYATARSFATAARLTAPLNLRLPVITYGGAIIVDPLTGAARQARVLPADLVEAVFRLTHGSPVAPPTRLGPRDRLAPATGQAVDLASSFP